MNSFILSFNCVWVVSILFFASAAVLAYLTTLSLFSLVFPFANCAAALAASAADAADAASFCAFGNSVLRNVSVSVFNLLVFVPFNNGVKISFAAFNSTNIFAAASADFFASSTAFCICWAINTLSIFSIILIKTRILLPSSCCLLYSWIPACIILFISSCSSV